LTNGNVVDFIFLELGSNNDRHIEDYNFSLSLTSSIQGTVAKYIAQVLMVMKEGISDIEKPLNQNSEKIEENKRLSAKSNSKTIKKIDPAALAAMSDSESASINEFNKDETVNPLAVVCTDVIDKKVRMIMKSVTGMDATFEK